MLSMIWYSIYIVAGFGLLVSGKYRSSDINICLDAKWHKSVPGQEPSLEGECQPYREMSCCSPNLSKKLQRKNSNELGFNYNHCNNELSEACWQWFVRNNCFYECSPNQGPWIVPDNKKTRNETFLHIPLCKQDCDDWWNACKNDLTCVRDWNYDFSWTTGTNLCPAGTVCQTFNQMYGDASTFCEQVWGESWKVVTANEPCMRIHWDGSNPNYAVARQYSKTSGVSLLAPYMPLFVIIAIVHTF